MKFVNRVRSNRETMPLEEAVRSAVDGCIEDNILKDFLTVNKEEVIGMGIFEYDEELAHQAAVEDGIMIGRREGVKEGIERGIQQGVEKGIKQGIEQGVEKGIEQGRAQGAEQKLVELVCRKLSKGKEIETIAEELEEELEYIRRICLVAAKYAPEYDPKKIAEELRQG